MLIRPHKTLHLAALAALSALSLLASCRPATAQANDLLIAADHTGSYDNTGGHDGLHP